MRAAVMNWELPPGQGGPRQSDDFFVHLAELAAVVNEDAQSGVGILLQEQPQVVDVAEARSVGELDLGGDQAPALFDDEIDFVAGSGAPIVQPGLGSHELAQRFQVQEHERFKQRSAVVILFKLGRRVISG